jgi:cytoskeletal protein RodZ
MQALGSILKQAREKRELTLTAAAEQTRISSRHLLSLEEGRYRDLPGGMYNRAFLRAYSEFLGLDPKPLLERLQAESTVPADKTVRPRARIPAESTSFRLHPLWAWGFMLLLSVAGVFFSRHWIASVFSPYVSKPAPAPVKAQPPAVPAQSGSKAVSQPAPVPVESTAVPSEPDVRTVPAALARSGIHIRFEVLQTCWASVASDGKSVLSRELNPGDDRTFDAAERITIVLGNAGGIRLSINDKPAKPLGKPGQVVRVVLTERSIPDFLESPAGQRP